MPMDDTLELSPEEAKQAKQRLKEEKKKLKNKNYKELFLPWLLWLRGDNVC